MTGYQGIVGPAGLADSIVRRLNHEITVVLSHPSVVEQLRRLGNNPHPSSPSEFKASMAADIIRWSKLVTEANRADLNR